MKIQNNQITFETSDIELLSQDLKNYFISQTLVAENELSSFINTQIGNYEQAYRQSQFDALKPLGKAIVEASPEKALQVSELINQAKDILGIV